MTMSLNQMFEQGKKAGGIPLQVELSVEEAQSIIEEVNSLRKTNAALAKLTQYKFLMADLTTDARLSFTSRDLDDAEKFKLLTQWTEGKICVSYLDIPLYIVLIADKNKKYHD